jgi:hypothetical protein
MRNIRWLVLPFLLLFLLGCGLLSGIQDIKNAATTQLPSILTSVPTAQGFIETLAAQPTSSPCPGSQAAGGLGVSADRARTMLQATGQFTFKDGIIDGQPASIATLASTGASTYSAIADGYSAQFIGDPCNLSRIVVIAPYTDQQETVDQGVAAAGVLFAAILPVDVQFSFLPWLAQNYANVPVSGQQQTTIKNMQFTLQRNQDVMRLEILPAQ